MDVMSYVMGQRSVESGGSSALLNIGITYDEESAMWSLDKTWAEIHEAASEDRLGFAYCTGGVSAEGETSYHAIISVFNNSQHPYAVQIGGFIENFEAETENDYPSIED